MADKNCVTGIKYCGGCNPHIDRAGLVREIEKLLPEGHSLATDKPPTPWETAILVCGCPIACADCPDVRGMAKHWIRVGGTTVDLESVPEDKMARVIIEKLKDAKIKERSRNKR